jgi:acyl-CoA reductase-like NAD-dependent aldehyde dehydrogenase
VVRFPGVIVSVAAQNFVGGKFTDSADGPHGGFKQSGYGKDLSMYGLEDYTEIKHVMVSLS